MEDKFIQGPGEWSMRYTVGTRLADICYKRQPVDCVQVRDWDFALGPRDQPTPLPTGKMLEDMLLDYVMEIGEAPA
jgi:hypothetical protein